MRLGILCPEATGHLNPTCALARDLKRRGCGIVFFCMPDAGPILQAAGMEFRAIGEREFPPGSRRQMSDRVGELQGLAARRLTFQLGCTAMRMHFRELPAAIQASGVDAMLIDQASTAGSTIAEACGLRFVTLCNALPLNREDSVPPFFTGWQYRKGLFARWRNRAGNHAMERYIRPAWELIQTERRRCGLPPYSAWDDTLSRLAQLSQLTAEFDFPRKALQPTFHFLGPWRDPEGNGAPKNSEPFPYERLTGKPLIYASLGTVQNRIRDVFVTIAEACAGFDAQLVIALGDAESALQADMPGAPLVVRYAPQQQLIARSALVITHAGMNTVMEALSSAVPMIAIPITNDQPGVAARLVRSGAGEAIPVSRVTAQRLRAMIARVLENDSYRSHARRMQDAIRQAGGVTRAADIVLQALRSGRPVARDSVGYSPGASPADNSSSTAAVFSPRRGGGL